MKNKIIVLVLAFSTVLLTLFQTGCVQNGKKQINAVVLVEFNIDDGDEAPPKNFSQSDQEILNGVFGKEQDSLYNFIYENSNGKEKVESKIIQTVKINMSVDYFQPKYSYDLLSGEYQEVNPIGYDNRYFDENGQPSISGKPSVDRFYREQKFVYVVTQSVNKKLRRKEELKNLTVIPSKLNRMVEKDSLLWPHRATYYYGNADLSTSYYLGDQTEELKQAKLGNKSINNYILIPYAFICDGEKTNITTLCHEYMHLYNVPDYYSYDQNPVEGIGEFDIMSDSDTNEPNLSLSYVRQKAGWLDEGKNILPITKSGEYDLYPTTSDKEVKAYKIITQEYLNKKESFYVEYRKAGEKYADLTSSGIIIYRANEKNGYIGQDGQIGTSWKGNAYGEKEVYVFRFARELFGEEWENRNEITTNGICYATVSDKVGYSTFGNTQDDKNAITYSDGKNSLITVTYLQENADGSVKIKVEMPEEQTVNAGGKIDIEEGYRNYLYFDKVSPDTTAYIVCLDKKIKNIDGQKLIDGKYGKPRVVSTEFLRTELPKSGGFEKFYYVCYKEKDGKLTTKEYYISGIKNIKLSSILIMSICVGVLIPSALASAIKIRKNLRRKKHG